jgi:hypothetical protein
VVLDGSAAYLVGPYGQTVVDISDPAHPRIAGGSTLNGDIRGIRDGFAYLNGSVSGLQVVKLNPLLPPPT